MRKQRILDANNHLTKFELKDVMNFARSKLLEHKRELRDIAEKEIIPIPEVRGHGPKEVYVIFKFRDLAKLEARIEGNSLYMTHLRVIPSLRRGFGLGDILMRKIITFAKQHKINYIKLNARDVLFEEDARDTLRVHPYKFYKKYGFVAGEPPEHTISEDTVTKMMLKEHNIPMFLKLK